MTPTDFTPLASLAGGISIGLVAVLLMAVFGRIAGVSGITVRLAPPFLDEEEGAAAGRWAFVLGLVLAPLAARLATGGWPAFEMTGNAGVVVLGGALTGFGAVWGAGCTSGHGICGLARLSKRSFVAVLTFMATAVVTVLLTQPFA